MAEYLLYGMLAIFLGVYLLCFLYIKLWRSAHHVEHLRRQIRRAQHTPVGSGYHPTKKLKVMKGPFCRGTNCPVTAHCERFKANIDMKKDAYLASVPYSKEKGKCAFYLGTLPGDAWLTLKNILNGKDGPQV